MKKLHSFSDVMREMERSMSVTFTKALEESVGLSIVV